MGAEAYPYVAGWGLIALYCVGVAMSKKRSALKWFVLGLVFGPMAALWLIGVPSLDPEALED